MKNFLLLAFLAFTLNAHAQLNKKWTTSQSLSGGIYKTKTVCSIDGAWWMEQGPYKFAVSNEYFEFTQDSIKGIIRCIDTSGNVQYISSTDAAKISSFLLEDEEIAGIPNLGRSNGINDYTDWTYLTVPFNVSPTSSRLIRIDSTGAIVWNIDVTDVNRISDWTVDDAGNTYLCGRTPETDSAGYKSNGIAIAKYDLNGNLVWKETKYTTGYRSVPIDIALDSDGRVIVCGKKAAKLFQPQTVYDKSFVTVYDNNGTAFWTKEYTAYSKIYCCCCFDGNTIMQQLGVDEAGDIYFADTQYDSQTNIPTVKLRKAAKLTGTVQFTKTINNAALLGFMFTNPDYGIVATTTGMKCYNTSGVKLWSNDFYVVQGCTLAFSNSANQHWVIAKNVEASFPLDYFLLELNDSTGAVLMKKNLSNGNNHDEYLGDYTGLSGDSLGNMYLLINDTVAPYGTRVTRLSQCGYFNTNFNSSVSNINTVNNAGCNNGQFRVNYSGTWNSWPHFEVWNSSQNTLIYSADPPPGGGFQLLTGFGTGSYTIKVYDESCGEQVHSKTIQCNQPSNPTNTTNINTNSAKANWNAPTCNVGTYKLQYRLSGNNPFTTISGINATSYTITGLQPGTSYQWKVATKCNTTGTIVYSNYSALKNFTTSSMKLDNGEDTEGVTFELSMEIQPNPAEDYVLVSSSKEMRNSIVRIFNMQGKMVLEKGVPVIHENEPWEINVQPFSSGIYLLQLQSEGESVTGRFVKE